MTTTTFNQNSLRLPHRATGAEVRAWATAHGYTYGSRGRFNNDLLAAFNADKANAFKKFVPHEAEQAITVRVKIKGKTETRKTSKARVRAVLIAAGELDKWEKLNPERIQRAFDIVYGE